MTEIYEGGCLCGAVRYRVTGVPTDQTHCHCTLCRKVSGSAFVTWASWPSESMDLTSGEMAYCQSSEKARRGFCSQCGSTLTFDLLGSGMIDLAVCTLDDPNIMNPADHIWTSTKISWIHLSDGLPMFSERRGI